MQTRKADNTIEKLKCGSPVKMVAIGDSLTYGWMVQKGYLDFFQEMLMKRYPQARLQIINAGIPGDTAEGGLHRLQTDVISHRPDCVLIQFALNDAYLGFSSKRFADKIRGMVHGISGTSDAEMVLLTSVWIENGVENGRALEFYDQIEAVAEENKLPIAKVHTYWKQKIDSGLNAERLVQFDGVHPTVAGYKLMAEAVCEVFEDEGKS
jgi:lysophospholipase L1-like esterase